MEGRKGVLIESDQHDPWEGAQARSAQLPAGCSAGYHTGCAEVLQTSNPQERLACLTRKRLPLVKSVHYFDMEWGQRS